MENKEVNTHIADLLTAHDEQQRQELERLGVVEGEPDTDNDFEGGARETAPRIYNSGAEIEEEHNQSVSEFVMRFKQGLHGA